VEQDRLKWNKRYAGGGYFIGPHPSEFLVERIDMIESLVPGRKALDIACGEGRNSIFLARRGFSVTGIDIADEGIAKATRRSIAEGLEISFLRADLEVCPLSGPWDLIINFNFLFRDLIPRTVAALNSGGIMLVDTLLDSPALPGEHNPAFLLQAGELSTIFAQFPGGILFCAESPFASLPTARLMFQKQ
jgi:2-polyprenyl-3-methyl-5-hydroxy-6-metoxy-1,4-benzoquinol methylase